MVMAHLLHACAEVSGWNLEVICVDHGLRPFDQERHVVASACKATGTPLHLEALPEGLAMRAKEAGRSLEEQGRLERYEVLRRCAASRQARVVFLAHHADDQAETLLLNLLRGTGPTGLAGMPWTRDGLFARPLLNVRRTQLRDYAAEHHVTYVEDPTNEQTDFRRNRIRAEVLPLLQAIEPAAVVLLGRTARLAQQDEAVRQVLVAQWRPQVVAEETPTPCFYVAALKNCPVASWLVRSELARFTGYAPSEVSLERFMSLLEASEVKRVPLGRRYWALREGPIIRIRPPQ